jgi:signal transduction histidine kinase
MSPLQAKWRAAVPRFGLWLALAFFSTPGYGNILWSNPGPILALETSNGKDILHGALKRDTNSNDVLYFKFRVDPLSDFSTKPYYAGFQLFDGDEHRLAVGDSPEAWAYSAFYTSETYPTNKVKGDYDLSSSRPELFSQKDVQPYELVRRGNPRVIIFKVQYVAGSDALVTVWLSPDLESGSTEEGQLKSLTTKFKANCSFDQVHVIHMGGGGGWIFSDMAIATSFDDFIVKHYWQTWWFNTGVAMAVLASVGLAVRVVEKRKFQLRLQSAEQERALERERARIAQDLHDELGSSLTRISLLSGLMRADRNDPAQIDEHLKKITQSADETVRKLEEIVWAVRPGSDSVQSLVEYIVHFANELFDGQQTRCRLDLPPDLPAMPLPPEIRHNIFLVVKEALTNVLRHSGAREVSVQARARGLTMEISVQDDGRGFDTGAPPQNLQDGLANMRRRAEAVDGKLTLESAPGKGTTVRLAVYLGARPK